MQKISRISGNRVLGYSKKLLDTRPSTRDIRSRVILKPYSWLRKRFIHCFVISLLAMFWLKWDCWWYWLSIFFFNLGIKMSKTHCSFIWYSKLDGAHSLTKISFLNANNNFNRIFNTHLFTYFVLMLTEYQPLDYNYPNYISNKRVYWKSIKSVINITPTITDVILVFTSPFYVVISNYWNNLDIRLCVIRLIGFIDWWNIRFGKIWVLWMIKSKTNYFIQLKIWADI